MPRRVEAFLHRPIYAALDPQILAGIEDERLEQAVVDFVLEHAKPRAHRGTDLPADSRAPQVFP